MPQIDQSKRLGSSTSPVINSVVQNSKNGQQPCSVPACVKTSFNKEPVKLPVK